MVNEIEIQSTLYNWIIKWEVDNNYFLNLKFHREIHLYLIK